MKFTEEKLEKAFGELSGQEGFPCHLAIAITRKPGKLFLSQLILNVSYKANARTTKYRIQAKLA